MTFGRDDRDSSTTRLRRFARNDNEPLQLHQPFVRLRTPIAEELPHVSHFANLVEVELRGDQLVLVARGLRDELPAWIAEIALAIKLSDAPRLLVADTIDRANEVRVRHRMRRLLELPQILRQTRHRRRGVEHDLGAIESELARAFRKVAVIADVHADIRITRLEHRVAEVPGAEVELLPEPGRAVRDVVLPILAEIRAVGIDDSGGVVVDAGAVLFVEWHDDDHLVLLGDLLHEPSGRPARDGLDRVIPSCTLLGAEVRAGEDLLHAEELHAFLPRTLDQRHVLGNVRLADGLERFSGAAGVRGLNETGFDETRHLPDSRNGECDPEGSARVIPSVRPCHPERSEGSTLRGSWPA